MTYALLVWTGLLALAGTFTLAAALLLERMDSDYAKIPAYVSGALYFMAIVTAAVAITLNVLAVKH